MVGFALSLPFSTFKQRNAGYLPEFWQKCKALYAGGPTLLNNNALLRTVMPTHANEAKDIYEERLKRAFYIPYPGSIIDKLVAELMGKPLTFELEVQESESESTEGAEAEEPDLPPYYADLVKNCGKPGGARMSLNQFAREQILMALQCQSAWALVDLPQAPKGGFANRAEQDRAGALSAYICCIDPETVIDWEERDDGELEWVLIQDVIVKRNGLEGNRNTVTLRWRYFRETDWAIYEISYDKTKLPEGPRDQDNVSLVSSGTHSFGKVPVRRFKLVEGLWAMGKLEAMARAHLNQRNALSWGQLKALFPVPVLYAMTPDPNNPVSEDAGRVEQTHGQGFLRVFAEKDKLEYFSPDTGPYKVAQEDLNNIRDEMHRVLYAMAQSVDNSGAALQRSGESKAVDQAAASVILRALGMLLREYLEEILMLISAGRKENYRFCAHGMDSFDDITLSQLVLDAIGLASVQIPSAHFQKLFKLKIAKLALGADVEDEDLNTIRKELENNVTQDVFDARVDAEMEMLKNPEGQQSPLETSTEKIKSKSNKRRMRPKADA